MAAPRIPLGYIFESNVVEILLRLFPQATIPVVQLSLDTRRTPQQHYQFAAMLRPLRRRGVLIVASGNIVHNLRMICWEDQRYPWAVAFDAQVRDLIQNREHGPLIDYPSLSEFAPLAIPTNEHYLPLLYALALQEPDDAVRFFADRVTNCSLSMRSLQLGR